MNIIDREFYSLCEEIKSLDEKEMYYRTADTELAQVLHHTIETLGKITCPES